MLQPFDKSKIVKNLSENESALMHDKTYRGKSLQEYNTDNSISIYNTANNQSSLEEQSARVYNEQNGTLYKSGKTALAASGNFLLNTAAGVLSPVIMLGHLPEAIMSGDATKVYDNATFNYVDKLGEDMYEAAANKYTAEQKDGFFNQTLIDGGFKGLSFMASAVATEAIMSAASVATFGAAGAAQAAQTANLIRKGKKLFDYGDDIAKAAKTFSTVDKAYDAARISRQFSTGALFEAGVEARGFRKEAVGKLDTLLQNGQITENEYKNGLEDIKNSENVIFSANAALVGMSNAFQFANVFGLGAKGLSKYVNKEAVSESLNQFSVGKNAVKAIMNPLSEAGEELAQSIFTKTGEDYVLSKYDRGAYNTAHSLTESFGNSISETLTNKDDLQGAFIGFVLGGVGMPNARAMYQNVKNKDNANYERQRIWSGGVVGEMYDLADKRDELKKELDKREALTQDLVLNSMSDFTRKNTENGIRQIKFNEESLNAFAQDDLVHQKNLEHDKLFSFVQNRKALGLENEIDEMISSVEKMSDDEFNKTFYGDKLKANEVKDRKREVIDSAKAQVKNMSESIDVVERLHKYDNDNIKEIAAYNLSKSKNLKNRIDKMREEIQKDLGIDPEILTKKANDLQKLLNDNPFESIGTFEHGKTKTEVLSKLANRKNEVEKEIESLRDDANKIVKLKELQDEYSTIEKMQESYDSMYKKLDELRSENPSEYSDTIYKLKDLRELYQQQIDVVEQYNSLQDPLYKAAKNAQIEEYKNRLTESSEKPIEEPTIITTQKVDIEETEEDNNVYDKTQDVNFPENDESQDDELKTNELENAELKNNTSENDLIFKNQNERSINENKLIDKIENTRNQLNKTKENKFKAEETLNFQKKALNDSLEKMKEEELLLKVKIEKAKKDLEKNGGKRALNKLNNLQNSYNSLLILRNDIQNRIRELEKSITQLKEIIKDLENKIVYYNNLLNDKSLKTLSLNELNLRKEKTINKLNSVNKLIKNLKLRLNSLLNLLKYLNDVLKKLQKILKIPNTWVNKIESKKELINIQNHIELNETDYKNLTNEIKKSVHKAIIYQNSIRYLEELIDDIISENNFDSLENKIDTSNTKNIKQINTLNENTESEDDVFFADDTKANPLDSLTKAAGDDDSKLTIAVNEDYNSDAVEEIIKEQVIVDSHNSKKPEIGYNLLAWLSRDYAVSNKGNVYDTDNNFDIITDIKAGDTIEHLVDLKSQVYPDNKRTIKTVSFLHLIGKTEKEALEFLDKIVSKLQKQEMLNAEEFNFIEKVPIQIKIGDNIFYLHDLNWIDYGTQENSDKIADKEQLFNLRKDLLSGNIEQLKVESVDNGKIAFVKDKKFKTLNSLIGDTNVKPVFVLATLDESFSNDKKLNEKINFDSLRTGLTYIVFHKLDDTFEVSPLKQTLLINTSVNGKNTTISNTLLNIIKMLTNVQESDNMQKLIDIGKATGLKNLSKGVIVKEEIVELLSMYVPVKQAKSLFLAAHLIVDVFNNQLQIKLVTNGKVTTLNSKFSGQYESYLETFEEEFKNFVNLTYTNVDKTVLTKMQKSNLMLPIIENNVVTYIPYMDFLKSTLRSNRAIKTDKNKLISRVQNMVRITPSKIKEVLQISEDSGKTKIDKETASKMLLIKGNTFTIKMSKLEEILSNFTEGSIYRDVIDVLDDNGNTMFIEDIDTTTEDTYNGEFITDDNGDLIITKKLKVISKLKPVEITTVDENKETVEPVKEKECVSTDVFTQNVEAANEPIKEKRKPLAIKKPKIGDTL